MSVEIIAAVNEVAAEARKRGATEQVPALGNEDGRGSAQLRAYEAWPKAVDYLIDKGLEPIEALDEAHAEAERDAIVAESDASEAAAEREEAARETNQRAVAERAPAAQTLHAHEEAAPVKAAERGEGAGANERIGERGQAEPEPRGAGEREPTTERGAEGKPQLVLPGAERITDAQLAQRRAGERLKPKVTHRPADAVWGRPFGLRFATSASETLSASNRSSPVARGGALSFCSRRVRLLRHQIATAVLGRYSALGSNG